MKHKKKLPLLDLSQGGSTPPSSTRRIFETWITGIAVRIGTWGASKKRTCSFVGIVSRTTSSC
eukprot:1494488-Prorocentrum_lima.AAC.1